MLWFLSRNNGFSCFVYTWSLLILLYSLIKKNNYIFIWHKEMWGTICACNCRKILQTTMSIWDECFRPYVIFYYFTQENLNVKSQLFQSCYFWNDQITIEKTILLIVSFLPSYNFLAKVITIYAPSIYLRESSG